VEGVVEGHTVIVGATRYVADRLQLSNEQVQSMAGEPLGASRRSGNGAAVLQALVAVDGKLAGVVTWADQIRPSTLHLLKRLPSLGIERTVLLSGDSNANVAAVASSLGITEARGELMPEDKVTHVARLAEHEGHVMMVGDGINDAPALSRADVGVALAGHGGGIAAESADVVILIDDPARVADAVSIARDTMKVARQSISVGLGLSAVAMLVAAWGYLPPVAGAMLQEVIDVAVILNALRARGQPALS
jgi:P-type E1-E2 ATPase